MSENLPLITKYRPQSFDDLLGNSEAVEALQRVIVPDTRPHAFLFSGTSGAGKTTTARIVAAELQAAVVEVDAATSGGVDAMRGLVESSVYIPMGGFGRRMVILDECHRASKQAFDVILKVLEEPPLHLFFSLCTTEPGRIPTTIKTRCYHVAFKPVRALDLEVLLTYVAECEGWEVTPDVLQTIVQASDGSPRQALNYLQGTHDLTTREEARRVISFIGSSEPLIELVQLLLRTDKAPWAKVKKLLEQAELDDFEEASVSLARYITSAMLNAESEDVAKRAWELLDALLYPSQSFDPKALFIKAVGSLVWAGR